MRALIVLGASLLVSSAQAGTGIDTVRFRPAGSPDAPGLLDATSPGEPWTFDAGAWLQFARRPVVFTQGGVPTTDAVVDGRVSVVFRAGYAIGSRFRIAIDVPVTAWQGGVSPITGEPLPGGGLGDLRILPHVQILDPRSKWLGLALTAAVTLPTGRPDALLGEGLPTIHPQVVAEKILASPVHPLLRFVLGAQAGYHLRPATKLLDLDAAGALTFGLGLRWEGLSFLRLGTEVVAALGDGENFRHGEWVTWGELRVDRRRRVAVTVGTSVGLGRGVGTPEGRIFAAVRAVLDPRRERAPIAQAPEPAVPVEAQRSEPPLRTEEGGWGLRLLDRPAEVDARVLFDVDSARLRSAGRAVLSAVARWYLDHRGAGYLVVHGHADPRGTDRYNLTLSQRRAEAVRAFLVSAGVPDSRLELRAHGEHDPASTPARGYRGPAGSDRYAADRRVVFEVRAASPSRAAAARR